jgi:glycosyltransferase involved in cell wall biosynthesis
MNNDNLESLYLEFTNNFLSKFEMNDIRTENLIKRVKMSLTLLGKCQMNSNVDSQNQINISNMEFEQFNSLDPSLIFYIFTARIPSLEDSKMANWYSKKGNEKQELWAWLYRCVSESIRLKSIFENVIFIKPANNTIMDVTHTSTYPFLTGIQRVVINIKENTSKESRTLAYWYFDSGCLLLLHDTKFRNMTHYQENILRPKISQFSSILFMRLIDIMRKNKNPRIMLSKIRNNIVNDVNRDIVSRRENEFELNCCEAIKANQLVHSAGGYYLSPFICNSTFIEIEIPQHPNNSLALSNFKSVGNYKLKSILYDLIPITRAQYVDQGIFYPFNNYIQLLLKSDEVIAISKLVAEQWGLFLKISDAPFRRTENNQIVKHHELPVDHNNSEFDEIQQKYEKIYYDFVMIGSLEPRKNHYDLLIAIEKLAQRDVRPSFAIIGGRGWKNSVELHILDDMKNRNFNVNLIKDASDIEVKDAIVNSKATIFLSKDEGFGLPISESLLLGKRVICYGVEPFLSIKSDNLVFIESIKELEDEIMKLYNNSHSTIKEYLPETQFVKWENWVKYLGF